MSGARRHLWVVVVALALAAFMALPVAGSAQAASTSAAAPQVGATKLVANYVSHPETQTVNYLGTANLGGSARPAGSSSAGAQPFLTKEFDKPAPLSPAASSLSRAPADSLAPGSGGAVSAGGLDAFDSGQNNLFAPNSPLDIEPPDQGLCAGNGYVVEVINLVMQVYTPSLTPVPGTLESLAGLLGFPVGQQFNASGAGGGYILSDPRCIYDPGSGHWFMTFLYFGGFGVYSTSGNWPLGPNTYGAEFVLASTGGAPTSWNIYYIDVSSDPLVSNCPCFGDQPLLGADANTVEVSTNEYPVFTGGFNGAQYYLFDKAALAAGSPTVNVVHFNIGQTLNPPDGSCPVSGGVFCWYSVDPTIAPTAASFDSSNGGTAWAVSSLDFTGAGDTRLAVWAFQNTSSITSATPAITLTLTLLTGLEFYASAGQLAAQENGNIPLGTAAAPNGYAFTGVGGVGCVKTCKVGGLATNGDGTWNAASYAQGAIWVAVQTEVSVGKTSTLGVAFFVVNALGSSISLSTQGYIALKGANLIFPSVAAGPSGNALVTFTLTGPSNFPSSAFAWISSSSAGPLGGNVYISFKGQSPQDGFTEYQLIQYGGSYRPRWGDYTFAVWSGGKIYFSTEAIEFPNCGTGAFIKDPTCGGTRDPNANWGTSLNWVSD